MSSLHRQPPPFDLDTLDERYEIRFDYDRRGNVRRMYKVRRHRGCSYLAFFFLALALLAGYYFIQWL